MSENKFTKKMTTLQETLNALKQEMKETGKATFQDAMQDFFAKYSWLKTISWTQYTPYFNDGDTCEFSCHAKWGDFEINDVDSYEKDEHDESIVKSELKDLSIDLKEMFNSVDDDIFQWIFGDHIKVIIHRNGNVEIEEYDHD